MFARATTAPRALVLLALMVLLAGACRRRGLAAAAGDASPAVASAAPAVESGPKSLMPLIRDCAARAVVFDVGGRAGVILSRQLDPEQPESPLTLLYATWDPQTATWTDEPLGGVTVEREVHTVTAEGTWDNPRLRIVHGNAALRSSGGHRTFWSLNSDGTVPVLGVEKKGGAWTGQPIEWNPGPMPMDESMMGRMMADTMNDTPRKPSVLEREEAKLVKKSPGCEFSAESQFGAPKGWSYGHLAGKKCKKEQAVAFHEVSPERGETFTWPTKPGRPVNVAVQVLGTETYAMLLKKGEPPLLVSIDKLFRLDGGSFMPVSLPPEETMSPPWKHGDELRAGGVTKMWRLRAGTWEPFGPGLCQITDDTPRVQLGLCSVAGKVHPIVSVVDGTYETVAATAPMCSVIEGHETAAILCGAELVELSSGKPGQAHPLPKGDGNDETLEFAGGTFWAARGRGARTNVFRLGSVGKSVSCTETGPLRLTPYVSHDGEAPITFGESNML